jgi:rRNA-processing protein FCF1
MDKIKVYLDTNTILDFFVNQAKAIKKKEEALIPEKTKFFLDNPDKMEFVTSFLTKTEIMRELVAGQNVEKDKVEVFWKDFVNLLKCEYVKDFHFDEGLAEVAGNMRLKLRTLMNFQHLIIAKNRHAYLASGDKDLIDKSRKYGIYDKVISYIELRQIIASFYQDS